MTSVQLALAAIFAVAAIHKLRLVVRHEARWHPIAIGWQRLRPAAAWIFGTSAVADIGLVYLLITGSNASQVAVPVVLMLYTLVAARRARQSPCNCFSTSALEARSMLALVVRNAVLGAGAVIQVSDAPNGTMAAAGAALCLAGLILMLRLLDAIEASRSDQFMIARAVNEP